MPSVRHAAGKTAFALILVLLLLPPLAATALDDETWTLAAQVLVKMLEGDRAATAALSQKLCLRLLSYPPGVLRDDPSLAKLFSILAAVRREGLNITEAQLVYVHLRGLALVPPSLACGVAIGGAQPSRVQTVTPVNTSPINASNATVASWPLGGEGREERGPEGTGSRVQQSVSSTGAVATIPQNPEEYEEVYEYASQESPSDVYSQYVKAVEMIQAALATIGKMLKGLVSPQADVSSISWSYAGQSGESNWRNSWSYQAGTSNMGAGSGGGGTNWAQSYTRATSSGVSNKVVDFNQLKQAMASFLRELARSARESSAWKTSGGQAPAESIENIVNALKSIVQQSSKIGSTGGKPAEATIRVSIERIVNSGLLEKALRSLEAYEQQHPHVNTGAGVSGTLPPQTARNIIEAGGGMRVIDVSKLINSLERSAGMLRGVPHAEPSSFKLPLVGVAPGASGGFSIHTPSIGAPSLPSIAPPAPAALPPHILLLPVVALVAVLVVSRVLSVTRLGGEIRRLEALTAGNAGAGENKRLDIVELFAVLLHVLGVKCRPKLPSETHREYGSVARGEFRKLYYEAAFAYEQAKFGGRYSSKFIEVVRRAIRAAKEYKCGGES